MTQRMPASRAPHGRVYGLRTAHATHVGPRPINQDSILTLGGRELRGTPFRAVVAVADGMGGHRSGEVASRVALEAVSRLVRSQPRSADLDMFLRQVVESANRAVYELAEQEPEHVGMGTTLTAVFATGSEYLLAHVGDSRGWLLRGGHLVQLTDEHTVLGEAIGQGATYDEAQRTLVHLEALTRGIGTDPHVEGQTFRWPFSPDPEVVVLCTDGIWKHLTEPEVRDELLGTPSLSDGCQALVARALHNQTTDNVSVVALERGHIQRRVRRRLRFRLPLLSEAGLLARRQLGLWAAAGALTIALIALVVVMVRSGMGPTSLPGPQPSPSPSSAGASVLHRQEIDLPAGCWVECVSGCESPAEDGELGDSSLVAPVTQKRRLAFVCPLPTPTPISTPRVTTPPPNEPPPNEPSKTAPSKTAPSEAAPPAAAPETSKPAASKPETPEPETPESKAPEPGTPAPSNTEPPQDAH